ncbi:hypothetical protein CBL_04768 [Carabus blaptoides fortunei]
MRHIESDAELYETNNIYPLTSYNFIRFRTVLPCRYVSHVIDALSATCRALLANAGWADSGESALFTT